MIKTLVIAYNTISALIKHNNNIDTPLLVRVRVRVRQSNSFSIINYLKTCINTLKI